DAVAKYKADGALAWSAPFSGSATEAFTAAKLDSAGNTWAIGNIADAASETYSFGPHSVEANGTVGILLKLDAAGDPVGIWSLPSGGELLIDPSDNVWVTGTSSGTAGITRHLSVGGLPLATEAANGAYVGRIGRVGADFHSIALQPGEVRTGVNFGNSLPLKETRSVICVGGADEDASRSVVTDPAGNAYYAGDFTGHTDFGGNALQSDGQNDAVFVKFHPGGKIAWAKHFGGDGDDLGHAIFADDNGTLFAAGTFQGTAQFGDFTLEANGMRDVFVLRLDDNGTPIWAFRAGGPRDDDALALVADGNGSLYVAGAFEETADFGPYLLSSKGNRDGYLLNLSYDGQVKWVGSLRGEDRVDIRALTLDRNNLPVVAGDFAGNLELRGTSPADDGSAVLTNNPNFDHNHTNQTTPAIDLTSGLVAHYPFDGNASDASGNGHDGNVTGATLGADRHGTAGKAYSFEAPESHISLANPQGLAKQVASVAFWVKANDDNPHTILSLAYESNGTVNADISIGDNRTNSLTREMVTFARRDDDHFLGTNPLHTIYNGLGYVDEDRSGLFNNDWHHVVLTFSGEANGTTVYLDGSAKPVTLGNLAVPMDPGKFAGLCPVDFAYVGIRKESGANLADANGSIDELRIYDRALTAEEVTALYELEKPASGGASGTTVTESWNFTNAAATGREGPTQEQVNTAYAGTNLAGKVTINTQGIQEWTAPRTGLYKVEVWGSAGGIGQMENGKGAYMSGNFQLNKGVLFKLVVGQMGLRGTQEAGGGGGSFVFQGTTPLIISGGGGGSGENFVATNANILSTGANGTGGNGGTGGTNGNGGSKGDGAGGGGWLSSGQDNSGSTGGQDRQNGFIGGNGSSRGAHGGFGGGGGGLFGANDS
ncbi:MAG: hypothetical protein HN558_18600, partial [Gemmatimonadetes bacterium]|nr:hypothetical protein [Gemmatimonadota bacterium]